MIDMHKPHWKHDCTRCKFLGATIGGGRLTDLYQCGYTLIARFSDDGPDYYSLEGNYINPHGHAELFVAKYLADRTDDKFQIEAHR